VASRSMINGLVAPVAASGPSAPASPHALARAAAPGGVDRLERCGGIGGQSSNGPRDGRVRGHHAIDARLGAQHRDVREAVPAQREHHRQVRDHLGRVMDRQRLAPPGQRTRELRPHPGRGDRLGQQHPTGLPDRPRRARVDPDAGIGPGSLLHLKGAPRTGLICSSPNHIFPGQEHFSVHRHPPTPPRHESARLAGAGPPFGSDHRGAGGGYRSVTALDSGTPHVLTTWQHG